MSGDPEPLLRVRDVAARLRLCRRTIQRYIAAGRLQAQKLPTGQWRIGSASLRALEGTGGASGQAAQDGEREPQMAEAESDRRGGDPRQDGQARVDTGQARVIPGHFLGGGAGEFGITGVEQRIVEGAKSQGHRH